MREIKVLLIQLDFDALHYFLDKLFIWRLPRFLSTSRLAISSSTCLSHAQHRFYQKSSFQSNANLGLSTIPLGNINKRIECSELRQYNL